MRTSTDLARAEVAAVAPRMLADFIGRWRLSRRITDRTGQVADLSGEAVWQAAGDGAICREAGSLRIANQTFEAERVYLWSAGLEVRFQTGRFFHRVPAIGGAVVHECPPDRYSGAYDFIPWPRWTCIWQVEGPRKSYRMVSCYERLSH